MSLTPSSSSPPEAVSASAGDTNTPAFRRLVVLGASAGGLDALSRVFDHVPPETGAAFVVIQHLSPDHPTMMDTLLARRTSMAVSIAQQGDLCLANRILLIPPGKHMHLRGDRIELFDKPAHGVSLPIDEFLISAARSLGERLVAVILSGTGSDGSRGVVQVSEWGGLVLAQTADSSEFDGMPESAMATGVVDQTLRPEDIGVAIGQLLRVEPPLLGAVDDGHVRGAIDQAEDMVQTLASIAMAVRQYTGLDLDQYKPDMLLRRIRRRMQLIGVDSLLNFSDRLVGNEAEAQQLRREVLIPVTRFFRDPETFDHLASEVLPAMLRNHPADQPFRVWIAACATGEEAYTLAMVLTEACQALNRWPNIKIYATDVEQRFLDIASAGCYPESIENELSPDRLARFFRHKNNQYSVKPDLRAMVVFARHNVLVDPPFTRLHLVSCRNMLIYLRQPAQEAVLRRLQFALLPQGTLILGRSESLLGVERDFEISDSRARVFRLTQAHKPILPPMSGSSFEVRSRGNATVSKAAAQQQLNASVLLQHLARQYAPPALLIDSHRQVLHMSGDVRHWLLWREGTPSLDLADLLPLELSPIVLHLIDSLGTQSDAVACTPPLSLAQGDVVVTAARLNFPLSNEGVVAISFERPHEDSPPLQRPVPIALTEPVREQLSHLERELASTRASLQATIEELQMTNEELQATNEELMASNEELQSTNEELQSVNEELYSVNSEYQTKVQMLGTLNADLEGMSRAVGLPHVFVDENLRLLRLTSEVCQLFNIRDTDIGRSIEDFSHHLDYPEFFSDLRRTMLTSVPVEREVRSDDGRWHLARLVPYTALSASMQSARRAVATFIDMTVVHDATRLQAIIDAMPANLAVLDREGTILSVNHGWRAFADANGDRSLSCTGPGKNYVATMATACTRLQPGDDLNQIQAAQHGLLAVLRGEAREFFQVYPCHGPTEQRWFAMHVTPLRLADGGALVAHYNVSGWVHPGQEMAA
jgi:two-component system CheB/CheR fusion protein